MEYQHPGYLYKLDLVISCGWAIRQIDIQNAFLHGFLNENIYIKQPPEFVDSQHPGYPASWISHYMASNKLRVPSFLALTPNYYS